MKNLRKDYIDMARGFAILLMVIGHSVSNEGLNTFIYSFHVPIFFVLSGMLWKERDLGQNVKRWAQSLLAPYAVVAVILCLYDRFYNWVFATGLSNPGIKDILLGISVPCETWDGIQAFGPVWFLVCMFAGKLIFELVLKIAPNQNIGLLTVVILLLSIGGCAISVYAMLPWSLDAALVSLIFSYIGWLMRGDTFPRWMEDGRKRTFLLVCCAVFWIVEMLCGSMDMAWRIYPNWPLCVLGAAGGSLVVIAIFYYLRNVNFLNKFLTFWGRNSMTVLCVHSVEKHCFPWGRLYALLHVPETEMTVLIGKLILIGTLVLLYTQLKKKILVHK